MHFILVLGNSRLDVMNKRVDRAIEEFRRLDKRDEYGISQVKLIFCGKGNKNITEAEYMSSYCQAKGVDIRDIITETKSKTTMENLVNTLKMLNKAGWFKNTLQCKYQFTICTSSFHIKRVMILSRLIFPELLNFSYSINFIHTNENVTDEEKQRERMITQNTLDNICYGIFGF